METFSRQVGVPHNCIWLGPNPPSWSSSFWYVPERHRTFNRSQLGQIAPFDEVMQELKSQLASSSSSSHSHTLNPLHFNLSWCPWVYKKEKYHHTLKPHHLHPIRMRRKLGERQTQYAHEVEESSREFRQKLEEIKARRQAERALREEMKEIEAAKEFERVMQQYERQQLEREVEEKFAAIENENENESQQQSQQEQQQRQGASTTPPPRTPPSTPNNEIVERNPSTSTSPRASVMTTELDRPQNSIITRRRGSGELIYPIQFSSKELIMLHKEWMNYRNNSRCSQDILMVNKMTQSIQIS